MAVYTPVHRDALDAFLAHYDIGSLSGFEAIAEGVENTNYRLVTTSGTYILTLFEKRTDLRELPYFLGLMTHAAEKGVPCPLPIRDRTGAAFSTLCGRPASIVAFLSGAPAEKIEPWHCAETGRALARFHRAAQDYAARRNNTLALSGWQELAAKTVSRAHEVKAGLDALIGEEMDYLIARWPSGLPSGVIHADLFPDNVLFLDGVCSGIIDLYFACNDFLAYDLAICVNAWCFEEGGSFNREKAGLLLQGYDEVRPLEGGEREAFPTLCRGAAMRFLLTRLYDWLNPVTGAVVTPKNPLDYAARLLFHRTAESIADYGLTP